jgi:hypothetical protein
MQDMTIHTQNMLNGSSGGLAKKKSRQLAHLSGKRPDSTSPGLRATQPDPDRNTPLKRIETNLRQKESGIVSTEARRKRQSWADAVGDSFRPEMIQRRTKGCSCGQNASRQEPIVAKRAKGCAGRRGRGSNGKEIEARSDRGCRTIKRK